MKPVYDAMIKDYRAEQEKLKQSIRGLNEKWLSVGTPVTIPHAINEASKRLIKHLEAGVEEYEEAIKILEEARNSDA